MFIGCMISALAYVVGAIPVGYFFCRYFFGIDITTKGSGNIGATNVARVFGKKYFIFILLLDAIKAYAMLALGTFLVAGALDSSTALYVISAGLLIGNAYSCFLHFRGGKGVATVVGVMIFILPWQLVVGFMACWLGVLGLTKKPFFASLFAMLAVLVGVMIFCPIEHIILMSTAFVWLLFRHVTNIITWFKTKPL
jgi:glycerol-3-phosphate acyltransferase PlsY